MRRIYSTRWGTGYMRRIYSTRWSTGYIDTDILHQMVYSQLRVNNLTEYNIVLILISTLYQMETVH